MNSYYTSIDTDSFRYISHYGIKGQKWGIRRYQNEDGSLKPGAEGRYSDRKISRELNKNERQIAYNKSVKTSQQEWKKLATKVHANKLAKKFDENIKSIDKKIKDGEERAKTLTELAKKKNYTVNSKEVTRYTNSYMAAIHLSYGNIPVAALSVGYDAYQHSKHGDGYGGFVKGKRYKVTK